MGTCLDRLQRSMPLLHSTHDHVWSYNAKDTAIVALQQLVPRDRPGSMTGKVVLPGLRDV